MLEGKLRIVSGKNNAGKIGNTEASSPISRKQQRAVSAVSKKIDLNKNTSPNKPAKKFNININGNNSTNIENLPQIAVSTKNSNTVVSDKINYSHLASTPNADKSPKILRNKLKIIKQASANNSNPTNNDNTGLLDENLKLRNAINKLKSDVTWYRAEISKFENELKLKEKIIEELLQKDKNKENQTIYHSNTQINQINNTNNNSIPEKSKTKEYQIITDLKKQFKDLQNTLKLKEDEVEKLKKLSNVTKLNEISIENRTLSLELERIKSLYDNTLITRAANEKSSKEVSILQENISKQKNFIFSLQERNKLLLDESNEKTNKINKLKEQLKEVIEEVDKLKSKIEEKSNVNNNEEKFYNLVEEKNLKLVNKKVKSKKLKNEISSKIEEINLLKNQIENLEKNSGHERIQEEFERKIKLKKDKQKILKSNLKEKSEEIEKLMNQINEISKTNSNGMNDVNMKFKEETIAKISKMKTKSGQLKNKLKKKEEDLEKMKILFNNELNLFDKNEEKENSEDIVQLFQKKLIELKGEVAYYKELSDKRENMINNIQELHMKNNHSEVTTLTDDILVKKLTTKIEQLKEELKEKDTKIDEMKRKNEEFNKDNNTSIEDELTEDQFNEITYILIKNFEANQLTMNTITEKIFSNLSNLDIFEESADKIMELLNNINPANKDELLLYLKYIGKNYGTDFDVLKEHFSTLLESMTSYSNETCEILNEQLKNSLSRYSMILKSEMKKKDPNNCGYITFFNLRKIIEHLKIEIDLNLMEYFIYQMKKFNDRESSFRDLKYGNVLNLIVEDVGIPDEEVRRGSKAGSLNQVFIPDKEFTTRTENVLSKIAEVLFSQGVTTRKFFTPTIIIEEKEDAYYTAMYLKLFLKILQDAMQLTLDVTDSLCLFNRLKNDNNFYNIEVIDIDKLVEEMSKFGIFEPEAELITDGNVYIINTMEKKSSDNFKDLLNNDDIIGNNSDNKDSFDSSRENKKHIVALTKSEKNHEILEGNLIMQIRNYIKRENVSFEKIFFLVHPYMVLNNFSHERLIDFQILVQFLFEYNIILSKIIDCNFLIGILDSDNFINVNKLKKVIYDEEEFYKKISKSYSLNSTCNQVKTIEHEKEKYEMELVYKEIASRLAEEFICGALIKFNDIHGETFIQKENHDKNTNDILKLYAEKETASLDL